MLQCGNEFEKEVEFKEMKGIESEEIEGIKWGIRVKGIEEGICRDIGRRIEEEAIEVEIVREIVGRESVDQGTKVLAAQSITGFSHSRYSILRIINCAPSGAIKKAL